MADPVKKTQARPDVLSELEKCRDFLENFVDDETGEPKYMQILQDIANRERTSIPIYLDDVVNHKGDGTFVQNIARNTRRYISLFSDVADILMPEPSVTLGPGDVFDVWLKQRQDRMSQVNAQNGEEEKDSSGGMPKQLTRRYHMRLIPLSTEKSMKLREIHSANVGSLVSVQGIVTRVTDVQPLIRVATYTCQTCGFESYQPITQDRSYFPLNECPSEDCSANSTKGDLFFNSRGSKFVKFQKIRLQELPSEVPVGNVPRSIDLRVYGDLCRVVAPGNRVSVNGVFLPAPYHGFRAVKAGLTTSTFLHVMSIEAHKKNFVEMQLTEEVVEEIEEKAQSKDIMDNLASSIAPEIYGMKDVKKALVLLLMGGVTRNLYNGMKIRGDINVLLMGDPGIAKSQLLKAIVNLAPRGVYTTGKGSSGVGLTASVMKDPVTGDMSLEGGALVLADKGICCIDEFDKMEDGDRSAIHEVMEQQTVSIAKAGITTTLNARTCILAAANPVYGRWNKKISAEKNLNLPAALLSRFDLCFKLLDIPNEDFDRALASHVRHVHTHATAPELAFDPFTPAFMRAYVAYARRLNPFIPQHLTDYITGSYVAMRQEDDNPAGGGDTNNRQRFCTARSLLSILRLSQGVARVHLRPEVVQSDIEEAMRLLYSAKRIDDDGDDNKRSDPVTAIYHMMMQKAKALRSKAIRMGEVKDQILVRGYSEQDIEDTLDQYQDLAVWTVSRDRRTVTLINMPEA